MAHRRAKLLFLLYALCYSLHAIAGGRKSYYDIFQVSKGASDDQIKWAYRKLAMKKLIRDLQRLTMVMITGMKVHSNGWHRRDHYRVELEM